MPQVSKHLRVSFTAAIIEATKLVQDLSGHARRPSEPPKICLGEATLAQTALGSGGGASYL